VRSQRTNPDEGSGRYALLIADGEHCIATTTVRHRIARMDRVLSLEKLQSVYECPISKAAARLNIGVTVLKKYCRWYSIERWPYRKIHSVDKLMDQLNELEDEEVVAQVSVATMNAQAVACFQDLLFNDVFCRSNKSSWSFGSDCCATQPYIWMRRSSD